MKNKQKKKHHNKQDNLSTQDIKELMGMYRSTYKRGKGGALKQK